MRSSQDKQENLLRSIDFIVEGVNSKADLVCFSEFQMAYSPSTQSAKELTALSEKIDGEFVSALSKAAKRNCVGVVATIYEKGGQGRVYDTALTITCGGK